MVNLKQVQADLANGVMVCRKTIQEAIDYAVIVERTLESSPVMIQEPAPNLDSFNDLLSRAGKKARKIPL